MFDSGIKLKLNDIALIFKNKEYNPAWFNSLIMRLEKPKTVALIFDSGKIVVTGTKTETDSKNAARIYSKILKSLGFKVIFKDFKIINIPKIMHNWQNQLDILVSRTFTVMRDHKDEEIENFGN